MQLHQLQRKNPNKKKRQVGRGGKRGKTSGRGTKGQKARAGHKIRPEIRDAIKRLPKLRGRGKNIFTSIQEKSAVIKLSALERVFSNGAEVKPQTLVSHGLLSMKKGKYPRVKILSGGDLSKTLTISGCEISKSAQATVEKAGGKVKEPTTHRSSRRMTTTNDRQPTTGDQSRKVPADDGAQPQSKQAKTSQKTEPVAKDKKTKPAKK